MTVTATRITDDNTPCEFCDGADAACLMLTGDSPFASIHDGPIGPSVCRDCCVKLIKAASGLLVSIDPSALKELLAYFGSNVKPPTSRKVLRKRKP